MRTRTLLIVALGLAWTAPAQARPDSARVAKLKKKLKARDIAIEDHCAERDDAGGCQRRSLSRTFEALARLKTDGGTVRILHLGDSHVAADLITKTIRQRLQRRFGNPGRGFTHPDLRWKYGGRRLKRGESRWRARRVVDREGPGHPYGFSGRSLESKRKGARISYKLLPTDDRLRIYYQRLPKGGALDLLVGGEKVGTIDTSGPSARSEVDRFDLPSRGSKLSLVARGPRVRLFGLSFERDASGVFYEPIGPVGADAKVYLQLERASFREHLAAHDPDLVVLMVGGNDALKIRKGWKTEAQIRDDHVRLIELLRHILPGADCMLWTPMDAGDCECKVKGKVEVMTKDRCSRRGKCVKVRSGAMLPEVRALQMKVAAKKGCAVWDLYESMGGSGSIVRWSKAKVMNADLVHPRRRAAELLGHLFADALLEAYDARSR